MEMAAEEAAAGLHQSGTLEILPTTALEGALIGASLPTSTTAAQVDLAEGKKLLC